MILHFENVTALSFASVVGKKEAEGPLGDLFDEVEPETHFNQKTWELAESQYQRRCAEIALHKANLRPEELDLLCSGDLVNQCTASAPLTTEIGKSHLGLYGACSTMAESLLCAATFVDDQRVKTAMALTSSHFSTAERQFRFPLSYGCQRTPTAQWTVTGAGCVILAKGEGVHLTRGLIGKPVEMGVTDANNMGAAMAPAACDTLVRFFAESGQQPQDYDCILTGDLGSEGSALLSLLLKEQGIFLQGRHLDCGCEIFDARQDVHAGGSGCGCSASVFCAKYLPLLRQKKIKRLLFMATGALMNATTVAQKQPIVGVAHLTEWEA